MAFPTNPSDGELYVAPNGTVYRYDLADDRWDKVGGGGVPPDLQSRIQGQGTISGPGWYRIATSAINIETNNGAFWVQWGSSSDEGRSAFVASCTNGLPISVEVSSLALTKETLGISKLRVVYNTVAAGNYAYVEVYYEAAIGLTDIEVHLLEGVGWTLIDPTTLGSIPGGYTSEEKDQVPGIAAETALYS